MSRTDAMWNALGELSRRGLWNTSDLPSAFRLLTETASAALKVNRAGVWLFDEARTQLRCEDLYVASDGGQHSAGLVVASKQFPTYFAALEERRVIVADDAKNDPVTTELRSAYLDPFHVESMLDAPVLANGSCVGVICMEHTGSARVWTAEETNFAGSLADLAALALEVHRRKEAEAGARGSEERLNTALDAAGMGTWEIDLETQQQRWSEQTGPLFGRPRGYTPATLEEFWKLIHGDDRDWLRDAVESAAQHRRGPLLLVFRAMHPDGTVRWLEVRGRVRAGTEGRIRFVAGVMVDVTERRVLEEQFLQAQKMEGLGRLAGGIAHDFNNLLTVIIGSADRLRRRDRVHPSGHAELDAVRDAAERAATLTRQLLAFARRHPTQPRTIDLGEFLSELAPILRGLLGEDVQLVMQVEGGPHVLQIDPMQLEQLIVNLVINARDAMPEGGRLKLEASQCLVPEDDLASETTMRGDWVVLTVEDTGIGMDSATQGRIFEPFFTTKEPGKGTGLGLATCYGIVRAAGGFFRVQSSVGEGTTFRVFFPRLRRPSVPVASVPVPVTEEPKGTERLLLVEDETPVRTLASSVLSEAGYDVVAVGTPEEALAIGRAPGANFALLVTDVVLPGINGHELSEQLRILLPELRVLFVSGYPDDVLGTKKLSLAPEKLLGKPFLPRALLERVRTVLDAR